MKKIILAGLLALPFAALTAQPAMAWTKFNFGVGANLGWQSGGSKNVMWGVYKSSDTPLVSQYYQGAPPQGFGGFPGFGGYPGSGFETGPLPEGKSEGKGRPTSYEPPYNPMSSDSLPVNFYYYPGW